MINKLAEQLWAARLEGTTAAVDDKDRPTTVARAYEIQRALTGLAGEEPVGWKLGATNDKVLELLGVEEPFVGPLLERFRYASGAEVPLPMAHSPLLETEIMVCLGADLPPREVAWTRDQVARAVAAVCPAFEIVGARLPEGIGCGGIMLIADAGANISFVQGTPVKSWEQYDLGDVTLRVNVNGKSVATGTTGVLIFGDPIDAVVWLANHRLMADRGLRTGDMIMTGTCAGVVEIKPGDEALADFGALGEVRASFC